MTTETKLRQLLSLTAIGIFVISIGSLLLTNGRSSSIASAQANPSPTPPAAEFDQKAALVKLREQIKGKGKDPASAVFKNIQIPMLKTVAAGQLLAIMEMGYSRSLGVNCTHCHTPDKWESDEKPQKQIARDMAAMTAGLNTETLKKIKNLSSSATVNCTTCHRGSIIPALNMPATN